MQQKPLKLGPRPHVWEDDELRVLQRVFDTHFAGRPLRRVLDAGAGRHMPLHIARDVHVAALDRSAEALARNENADEKIVGDIHSWQPAELFDAVICWWVLEHVPRPRETIERLAGFLASGGLLVVGVPYLWSFKALATRITPYRFHVWFARRSNPDAGTDAEGPFPTFLSRDISPRRLRWLAARNGLVQIYAHTHGLNAPERQLPRPLRLIWKAAGQIVRGLTFGRFNPLLSEHIAVFAKSSPD